MNNEEHSDIKTLWNKQELFEHHIRRLKQTIKSAIL